MKPRWAKAAGGSLLAALLAAVPGPWALPDGGQEEPPRPLTIVDVDQVREALLESGILDARSMEEYLEGHIPYSHPADLAAIEAAVLGDASFDPSAFIQALGRTTLDPQRPAIVYDASRPGRRDGYLAWLLSLGGVPEVQILDGGFAGWNLRRGLGVYRGHPVPRGMNMLQPENLTPRPELRVDAAELGSGLPEGAAVVEVLPAAPGEADPPAAGPGRLRADEVLSPDGRFLFPYHLRNLLAERGVDPDARLLLRGAPGDAGLVWAALAGNRFDAALITSGTEGPVEPTAPDVPVLDADGLTRHLEGLAGKIVVVSYWATWCLPCVQEMPLLARVAREYAGRGVEVLGVSCDLLLGGSATEKQALVRTFLARHGAGLRSILFDGSEESLAERFAHPGPLPHTTVLGPDGALLWSRSGMLEDGDLQAALDALLARDDG